MVKINGVKATSTTEVKNVSPSINEVLDRMDNNFQARQIDYDKKVDNENKVDAFGFASNTDENSNLLLSILPLLLSKDKKSFSLKNSQNEIIKLFLKKSNNPMLLKIFELLPKISNLNKTEIHTQNTESAQNNKSIDDFVKTDDYNKHDKENKE